MKWSSSSRRGWKVGALVAAVGLAVSLTAVATAQGGNAGAVKLHDITDAINDTSDNPKPCDPVLVSFNFNVGDQYTYQFVTQPGGALVIGPTTVTVLADPQQEPLVGDFRPPLVDGGQYKLQWDPGPAITGGAKQKVFKVNCGEQGPSGTFEVTKTVSGVSAPGAFAFDVHIACSDGSESDVVLSDQSPSASISNLDVGTTCTVTEGDPHGATATTYSPAQTSEPIADGATTTITINNAFDPPIADPSFTG